MAPGYAASTHLLTRYGPWSDFATDVCVRRQGRDPETGTRYLEEVCFEVVDAQSNADVIARGVRRIFGIFVKGIGIGDEALLDESATVVKEWSRAQHGGRALAGAGCGHPGAYLRSEPGVIGPAGAQGMPMILWSCTDRRHRGRMVTSSMARARWCS